MKRARRRSGYLLGFTLAIMSPFNIGFWLAVVGSQQRASHAFTSSLALAGAVVLGAIAWSLVLCLAVKLGARDFRESIVANPDASADRARHDLFRRSSCAAVAADASLVAQSFNRIELCRFARGIKSKKYPNRSADEKCEQD